MKKQTILILLIAAVGLASCDDWFDVTASNEIREEGHYDTEDGFRQSLIGCYIAMGDVGLFGKNMSWYVPELAAHQYRAFTDGNPNTGEAYAIQQHRYAHAYVKPVIEDMWERSYNVIANADEALKFIDEKEYLFDPINFHVIKGELLAVRAYMHFQLLRMYGYGNWSNRASELNAKYTIPYVTQLDKEMTPQSTGAEVLNSILTDLSNAVSLLKDYDPVTGALDLSAYNKVNEDGFYQNRNFHLNYYAVRALQAQVYMWEGSQQSKTEALKAAEEIIQATGEGVEKTYTSDNGSVTSFYVLRFLDTGTLLAPNYSMIPEAFFALDVQNLDTKTSSYIKPYYQGDDYLAFYLEREDAENLYEKQTSDIRFNTLLQLNSSTSIVGYVPLKLYQGTSMNYYYKNKIPLIRLPEIYYIAAECYATAATPNLDLAMERLNTVREKRGLYTPLENLSAEEVQKEIQKEYQKEFLSEGVMFYYYKRTGAVSIPRTDGMGDENYVLPYPDFEIQSGRVQ